MPGPTTRLLTIAEFDKLDLPQDRLWELHNGELVEMTFPALVHRYIQDRLVEIFKPLFRNAKVLMEYPFQVAETQDKRAADVGVVELARAQDAMKSGILAGTPELVVEVLSPSNSESAMRRYRRLCFEHDTITFWIVDPDDNTIEVYSNGTHCAVYKPGEAVPLNLLGVDTAIPVSQVFAGITL